MPGTLAFFSALAAVAFGVLLLFGGMPASAAVKREQLSVFDQAPGHILLSDAVDNSSGPSKADVYVADFDSESGVSTVQKLGLDGTPLGAPITGADTPAGSFSFLSFSSFFTSGIAVDGSNSANAGDLYVSDIEHSVVDKFSESGEYLCQITGSSIASPSECAGVAGSQTPDGSFSPAGLTIDSTGTLYVADPVHKVIDVFSSAGQYIMQIADPHITIPGAMALDSAGNLYVVNAQLTKGFENVIQFNHKGEFVSILPSVAPIGIAASSRGIDVSEAGFGYQISEYDPSGSLLDAFATSRAILALASASDSADLYASAEGAVYRFGPPIVTPTVTTAAATGVQNSRATLNGEVAPDVLNEGGEVTLCQFEYGTSTSYGQTVACAPSAPYSSETGVSASVALAPSTEYHFRLAGGDAGSGFILGGVGYGEDETLTTTGRPGIDLESSSSASVSSVTLSAQVRPFGLRTSCEVQYVDQASFEESGYSHAVTVPCQQSDLGAGFSARTAVLAVSGLSIGTVYHYRFLASNSAGVTEGADTTFATFGLRSFSMSSTDRAGVPYSQAGGHPYELTMAFSLNTTVGVEGQPESVEANPKDIHLQLPAGLIGNPTATVRCTSYAVTHADCTGAAQVGMLEIFTSGGKSTAVPIYNLVAPAGMAGQFGARFNGIVTAHIDASVSVESGYRVTADSLDLSAAEGITGARIVLWGVPADASHDGERYCPAAGDINEQAPCLERGPSTPFLTNPTSCEGPEQATLSMDSWQQPGAFVQLLSEMPPSSGCERLSFDPSVAISPESRSVDSPSGLQLALHVPQNADPRGLASGQLRDLQITLPSGMAVNPAGANGLMTCSAEQISLGTTKPAACPDASKIGTVELRTPLIDRPLHGGIYVASPVDNPFHSLLALYVTVDDAQTGVVIKLASRVALYPGSGRITVIFDESPQLPLEDLDIRLFGGDQGILATPQACGTYIARARLDSWSDKTAEDLGTLSSPFSLTEMPDGLPCQQLAFAPSLVAGVVNNRAAASSALTVTLARGDGEQRFGRMALELPAGLAAALRGVARCQEPAASTGDCPSSSQIGHVTVVAGVGRAPITLPAPGETADPVYLTGSYRGAPFGLSIIIRPRVGPFDLSEDGRPVVVRAGLAIDPHTARVSILSDPLPSSIQGISTDVRTLNVTIDRSRFVIDPTNCRPTSITGTIESTQGTKASVASHFQVSSCSELHYTPKFSGAISSKFSRRSGIGLSLTIKPTVGQANTRKIRLMFPKQLSTRLSTLKSACLARVFETDVASCPNGSVIGNVVVRTPMLSAALTGPVYFVSHGKASFPDVEMVLQAEGVKLVLDGKTSIRNGATSSTFNLIPDLPFTFLKADLPAGPHSAFAAVVTDAIKGSLCGHALGVSAALVAQNGMQLTRTVKLVPKGCGRSKRSRGSGN